MQETISETLTDIWQQFATIFSNKNEKKVL